MKCGLLGRKLGHSYSPAIHALLGDYEYALYEKEPEELEAFLRHGDWDGLNVTMPYKKAVIPYLNELTRVATYVGAVNTIYRHNGKLIGHNTDFYGFHQMIQKSGVRPGGKKCLVLGSGGASDVAVKVLTDLGGKVIVISRTGENHYANLHRHQDAAILVNATPVGMYPHTGVSPVDLENFPALEAVLDVVYNPARTQLLMDAESRGIVTENGLWMLVSQAKEASSVMTGELVSGETAKQVYHALRRQTENIILIGMPGCGKTTIGRLLAGQTARDFIDTDAEVEKLAKKPIPDIFAQDGEEAFRRLEKQVLSQYGKQSGLVIATGGGCVTIPENYPVLHQNGTIFFLQRDVKQLPTNGRPLSLANDLAEMYQKREPLYQRFADHVIDNNDTPEKAAKAILEKLL